MHEVCITGIIIHKMVIFHFYYGNKYQQMSWDIRQPLIFAIIEIFVHYSSVDGISFKAMPNAHVATLFGSIVS